MLTGIIQIGEYILKNRTGDHDELENIIESPNDNGRYNHIFKITFEKTLEKILFKSIEYEEFSNDRIKKYAYKKGSGARGGDRSPTSKLTEPAKTVNKIKTSIKDILESSDQKSEGYDLYKELLNCYDAESESIIKSLDEKVKSISFAKGESAVVTVNVLKDGQELYVGDFNIVKNHLLKIAQEQYYNKYEKISKGTGVCYYCKSNKDVYGFVSTYKFYTLDKAGFVSSGFKQEKSWINYPVCGECALYLETGKKYIEENLTSKFCGFDYSIIPKFTFNVNNKWKFIKLNLERFEKQKFSTADASKRNLLKSEDNFLKVMSESENNLNYNMMIFREEQSGSVFRILLYVEDIVPSKLKNLLKVKDIIDDISLFKGLPGKDDSKYDLEFGFDKIRFFFPNSKTEGNYDKSFLEIVNNIFSYKKVSYNFILGRMIEKIREIFCREEYFDSAVLQALMIILYITKLGLFQENKKEVKLKMVERNEKNAMYLDFIEKNLDVLDTDFKRAVFLEGVLVDKLLNIQYKERGSKPFYSRLNGLKLNEKVIKRIFTEAVNKLNEYDKNYYVELESLIANYLLSKNNISDDEISFYFVLGMTLSKKFMNPKDDKEGVKDND